MNKLKAIIAILFAKEWIVFADESFAAGCSIRYLKKQTKELNAALEEVEQDRALKEAKHIINSKPNLN